MKRFTKILSIVFGIVFILLTGSYVGLSVYYTDGFMFGTWINGEYCTGKSIDEVDDALTKLYSQDSVLIEFADGHSEILPFEKAGVTYSFRDSLISFQQKQNRWTWPLALIGKSHNYSVLPVFMIDESLFNQAFHDLKGVSSRKPDAFYEVKIVRGPNGYELKNDRVHVLNVSRAYQCVYDALLAGTAKVSLEASDCYEDLALTDAMKATVTLFDAIDDFQNCHITYCFGDEEVPIPSGEVSKWLILDEHGQFTFDESDALLWDRGALDSFVEAFLEPYNTYDGVRNFQTTRGDVVTISGGTYGNLIDVKAEKEYLYEAFSQKRTEKHEPKYIKKALYQGLNDIGDTYIEVDMGNQMMYYYVDGKQEIATPIVTGNMVRKRDTPSCVCFIYHKQKNRTLKGPGYASFVHFWMPVKRGIGIHDAPWRDEFGGDIYKTEGSHGCINTPYEPMKKLYSMAEIGTPVVMFY